ncbi:MAG: ankyrin repeat domain-containing protein [Alphaproteobacteria bacterium]
MTGFRSIFRLLGILALSALAPASAHAQGAPLGTVNFGPDQFSESLRLGVLEAVQRAVNGGRSVNEIFTDGTTPLTVAAKNGQTAVVEYLVQNRAALEYRDRGQATALLLAAERGHAEIVDILLKAGADPNVPDRSGDTPLIKAAKGGYTDAVRVLVASKVDLKRADYSGLTALDWAERNRHATASRVLRAAGAN